MSISRYIQSYFSDADSEHHRYRSWEHCYLYFRKARANGSVANCDEAALQLGFYLASWGMYRGSSFLLQHAYTVHRRVIEVIWDPQFTPLWNSDFGASKSDNRYFETIHDLIVRVKAAYKPFVVESGSAQPTDTLVTKIILGTFGTLPACDRYFIEGLKHMGLKYSYLNESFTVCILDFCLSNLMELQTERDYIHKKTHVHYPLMKLVDMYFWQIGFELDQERKRKGGLTRKGRGPMIG